MPLEISENHILVYFNKGVNPQFLNFVMGDEIERISLDLTEAETGIPLVYSLITTKEGSELLEAQNIVMSRVKLWNVEEID
jgi:hypothetical protein